MRRRTNWFAPEIPQAIEPAIEVPASEEDLDVVGEAPTVVSDRDAIESDANAIESEPAHVATTARDAAPDGSAPQLSDDAATDLLTSDPELPPIPNLAELLAEDEPTGDDIVDNANAFLAHAAEESSEPVNEAPTIEGALSAPEPGASSATETASSAPVEEAGPESYTFTAPADLLAEASRPNEQLSDAAPVDTTITLDVPRSEEIAPTDDRIDVKEYEPTEAAGELDIGPVDVTPARAEVPEAESEAPEVTGPSLAPPADELVSPPELELHRSSGRFRTFPPGHRTMLRMSNSSRQSKLNWICRKSWTNSVLWSASFHLWQGGPLMMFGTIRLFPSLKKNSRMNWTNCARSSMRFRTFPRPQIDDHDEHTAVESAPETLQEVDEPFATSPHVLDEAPSGESDTLIAPAAPVAEMREDSRSPAPEPAVSAGSGSLNDLLSIMSRDAGSFMGGMPLAIAPISTPGVVPVTLKLKEDPPVMVAPPTPVPVGKVEPKLPAGKVVGVPPKEEVDEESSFFEDKLDALDDLPDELEPIGDITEAVGEAPAAPPPKPASPRQTAPRRAKPHRHKLRRFGAAAQDQVAASTAAAAFAPQRCSTDRFGR